jgi:hypothetical protein
MTAGMIDYMQAITTSPPVAAKPFKQMPTNLTPNVIVGTLQALGLAVPPKLSAAAAKGEALRAADYRYTVKEVDAALTKANVPLGDRFRFKTALDRNNILGT